MGLIFHIHSTEFQAFDKKNVVMDPKILNTVNPIWVFYGYENEYEFFLGI